MLVRAREPPLHTNVGPAAGFKSHCCPGRDSPPSAACCAPALHAGRTRRSARTSAPATRWPCDPRLLDGAVVAERDPTQLLGGLDAPFVRRLPFDEAAKVGRSLLHQSTALVTVAIDDSHGTQEVIEVSIASERLRQTQHVSHRSTSAKGPQAPQRRRSQDPAEPWPMSSTEVASTDSSPLDLPTTPSRRRLLVRSADEVLVKLPAQLAPRAAHPRPLRDAGADCAERRSRRATPVSP